jgi:alpha-L-fucosidase 2
MRCNDLSFSKLYRSHLEAFQQYYHRVSLNLGQSPNAELPTDERLRNFALKPDADLVALYFQFGRYLLISSSQPGGQPANLQGIWNDNPNPVWDSKYTININTEMNYWPAEKCNLSEMHDPLLKMVGELSETGRQTAQNMYGCQGWVAHHNTDIWRITGVVDGAYWGMWPMGGAWLSQHLWERYAYDGDVSYLETVYPILKSACAFYQGFLVEEPVHGWLVVSPSISPENNPQGRPSVCAGTTMDNQILFDLFTKTIKAAAILGKDQALMADFQKIADRLPPMQIGQYGQLQEWMEDLDNPNDQHRHVSHLYGLYPGNQISPATSAELFQAARTTLTQRGDVSTGWSMGWKVNFWARLLDGNHALKLIKDQLTLVDPLHDGGKGGTYPNLFDAHPPFQIDGNFGCTAGISEMLLQCHNGAVHLLPALPDDWANGQISGLRTVGGFETDFTWANGKIQKVVIKSTLGGNLRLRLPNGLKAANGKALTAALGINPNPFFEMPQIKQPLVSAKANISTQPLKPVVEYDIPTQPGQVYTFVGME